MENNLLKNLNKNQKEAVTNLDGPMLVLAGAGSGKTRVITRRIVYGIKNNLIRPNCFLAVTFTNKAAEEMRSRIANLLNIDVSNLWIKTFHSACSQILRTNAEKIGISRYFSIYDSKEQLELIKNIIKEIKNLPSKYTPAFFQNKISRAKNNAVSVKNYQLDYEDDKLLDLIKTIYEKYENKLKENNALDFGDLIFKTVDLLKENEIIRKQYSNLFEYILVDEYQDTNHAQYLLIKLLTNKNNNLCVVGDDDQSIYRWRGADINNILNFKKDYPETKIIKLQQNYRSTPEILKIASSVILFNKNRMKKELWSTIENGEKPEYFKSKDDREEALYVAEKIASLKNSQNIFSDFAVFYRTNWQSRILEETFLKFKIPYKLIGGVKFYDRKEVKDLISYLRLAVNPHDILAFKRAISVPPKGIGKKSIERIHEFSNNNNLSIIDGCKRAEECKTIKGKTAKESLQKFASMIGTIYEIKNPYEAVIETIEISGLKDLYSEDEDRYGNIQEFANAVNIYQDENPDKTLEDFLIEISLISDIDIPSGDDSGVNFMTIHNAKGLEFENVFITGMENGLFPHFLSSLEDDKVEEERRLFYVGITRAKQKLFFTSASQRFTYGKISYNEKSQFIDEIPKDFYKEENKLIKKSNSYNKNILLKKTTDKKQKFKIGDRVIHPEYGEGKIIKKQNAGEMSQIHVDFNGKRCLFIEKYSNLKLLSR